MDNTFLIGITGKAGSGKDTFARMLGFETYAFAKPLKAALAVMGMPEPPNRDLKEHVIPGFTFTWRKAAQTLGTEWGRSLQPDIWLQMAMQYRVRCTNDFLTITDVRFHNEADWVREHGILVHLHGRKTTTIGEHQEHASEATLPAHDGDFIVNNSGTIADLIMEARRLDERIVAR